METIVVCKLGQVIWKPDNVENPMGEQGCTWATLEHLAKRTDIRTVFLGFSHGDLPEGIIQVKPDSLHLDRDTETGPKYQRRLDRTCEELKQYNPRFMLHSIATKASWSHPDNPCGVQSMTYAMRHVGFGLYGCVQLNIPRIVLITDYRGWPAEHEMTMHPILLPRACLSQRTIEVDYIARIPLRRREVWCGAENWIMYNREMPEVRGYKNFDCMMLANCHLTDGFHQTKNRKRIYDWLELNKHNVMVRGKGWEQYDDYDPDNMPGPVDPQRVIPALSRANAGIVIPPWPRFTTPKIRLHALAGCVPLLFSPEGDDFEYDPDHRYVPPEHWSRLTQQWDIPTAIQAAKSDLRDEWLDALLAKTEPSFAVLDACIDAMLNEEDHTTDEWWQQFGGVKCRR